MSKLKYYLIPMERAAAWQVVVGFYAPKPGYKIAEICGAYLNGDGEISTKIFNSNTERDEWIAAVHKHLAEWAYGKDEVPEAVREADELFEAGMSCRNYFLPLHENDIISWREKWMKPREPREIEKYLYEV